MSNYVLVKIPQGSRGKLSNARVISLITFIYGGEHAKRRTQLAEIDGGYSKAMCEVTIEEFEEVFSPEDIETMRNKGILNYYPKGAYYRRHDGSLSEYCYSSADHKYPTFSAKIYKKYGVAYTPEGVLI